MYKNFFKRVLDFCIALVALLLIGWLLILIAIWLPDTQRLGAMPSAGRRSSSSMCGMWTIARCGRITK